MSDEHARPNPNHLAIELVPGEQGPIYSYPEFRGELNIAKAVITENGTKGNLPIVDFVMEDKNGNKYFGVLTGRLVNALSAAIKGVNLRNHGVEEP